MRFIYHFILSLLFVFYLPTFLARWQESRKDAPGFSTRLGIFSRSLRARLIGKRPIWLQAVSVGEVLCLKKFLKRFHADYPEHTLALSTTTVTGQRLARSLIQKGDTAFYFPVDFAPVMRRAVRIVSPKAFILVETEIWPGVVNQLKRFDVPIAVINGRISERSYTYYRRFAQWMKPTLRQIDRFLMQTERDAERVISIGAPQDRVKVVGNLKYDNVLDRAALQRPDPVTERLERLWPKALIWVAGSIHMAEIDILVNVYQNVLRKVSDLHVVFAPRHIRHVSQIETALQKRGIQFIRWSQARNDSSSTARVLIVDTLGELASFYRVARVVFVGGSLVAKGGQNPIEAAQFSKPVLYGPHVFNFFDAYDRLQQGGGGFLADASTLVTQIQRLLRDSTAANEAGRSARKVVEEAGGACERTFQELKGLWAA